MSNTQVVGKLNWHAKLDWHVSNLQFQKNCKNKHLKGKQASGKVAQLFLSVEEHSLTPSLF